MRTESGMHREAAAKSDTAINGRGKGAERGDDDIQRGAGAAMGNRSSHIFAQPDNQMVQRRRSGL